MGKIRTSKRTHSKRKSLKRNNLYLKGGANQSGVYKGQIIVNKVEEFFRKTLEFYDNEFKSVAIESYSFKDENIGFLTEKKDKKIIRYYDYFEDNFIVNDNFDTYISNIQGKINKPEAIELEFKEKKKKFDPEKVYKGQPNPTKL